MECKKTSWFKKILPLVLVIFSYNAYAACDDSTLLVALPIGSKIKVLKSVNGSECEPGYKDGRDIFFNGSDKSTCLNSKDFYIGRFRRSWVDPYRAGVLFKPTESNNGISPAGTCETATHPRFNEDYSLGDNWDRSYYLSLKGESCPVFSITYYTQSKWAPLTIGNLKWILGPNFQVEAECK